jgi:hypothetical protein
VSDYTWPPRPQPAKTTLWRAHKAVRIIVPLWCTIATFLVVRSLFDNDGSWLTWLWALAAVVAHLWLIDYTCRQRNVPVRS